MSAKYRIIQVEYPNKKIFEIQEKSLFGWNYVTSLSCYGGRLTFDTVEEAEKYINIPSAKRTIIKEI